MSLLNFDILNFFNRFGLGKTNQYTSAPINRTTQLYQPGQEQYETINDNEAELFETTGVLNVVIGKKASMKSAGRWKHYKRLTDDRLENLGETDVIKLLNNPNPLQSKNEFLTQLELFRSIYGANFMYGLKGFNAQPVPSVLYNFQPDQMTINTTGKVYQQADIKNIIKSFTFDKNGQAQHNYDPNEILYMRTPNPRNPILPISPFHSLNMEISNIRASMGYRNVILRKKGAIGMISNNSKDGQGAIPLSAKEKKEMEAQYQNDYGIGDEQMKVLITQASMTWTPMTYPTKDLMLFEEVDSDMKKIIDFYGLNENLFSRDNQSTYDNILAAHRIALETTIIPESIDDAEAITRYLGLPDNEFVELDYSHLPALKDDEVKKSEIQKRKAETYKILREQGIEDKEAQILAGFIDAE